MWVHIKWSRLSRPVNTMATCDHCGSHVSEQFVRVFADENGQIRACPSCSANAGIAEAARQRTVQRT